MDEERTTSGMRYEERYLAAAAEGMLRAGCDADDIDDALRRISPYARTAAGGLPGFVRGLVSFCAELGPARRGAPAPLSRRTLVLVGAGRPPRPAQEPLPADGPPTARCEAELRVQER